MTQPTAQAPTSPDLPNVYVLSVDYRDGSTTIVRISHNLDDLFNHYGPDSLSPVQPWEAVSTPFVDASDTSLWSTRFASGNDGAHLWIRRMPLHGSTSPTDDAALLDNYDPTRSLVARGVMTDPTEPTDTEAVAGADASGASVQCGCPQCHGINSGQCPRCEFEAEYDADVTALSTLITDGLATKQTPEKIARTILASEWLDEANDRLVTPMIEGATARLRNQVLALIPTDNPELIDAGYTILASDVLDRLGHDAPSRRTRQDAPSQDDLANFRTDFYLDVPGLSDNAALALMDERPNLLALARQHGWNDTEVRDQFAALLEARGYTLD